MGHHPLPTVAPQDHKEAIPPTFIQFLGDVSRCKYSYYLLSHVQVYVSVKQKHTLTKPKNRTRISAERSILRAVT